MRHHFSFLAYLWMCFFFPAYGNSAEIILDEKLHHLRSSGNREWSDFSEKPESPDLQVKFQAKENDLEYALRLRMQDVKQSWVVQLNETLIGQLPRNENDMVVYFAIPKKSLTNGQNVLVIKQKGRPLPDDVRIGEIALYDESPLSVLSECSVSVEIIDAETQKPVPGRITIADANGSLASVGATSNQTLAVRPGVIYTSNGAAEFGLPEGQYKVHAGRGFEWGIETIQVKLKPGEHINRKISIHREVPTEGYAAADTHVHTRTFSGHGDCSIDERMITLAAEGIELPIATDHNTHVDYDNYTKKMRVESYFTPVIGNEVTTKIGHFNVFPVKSADTAPPNYRLLQWDEIFKSINETPNIKAVILNHARDVHSGYRPFDVKHHISLTGENLDGWELKANAMEVINSGATQTNIMQLFYDWMGLLNRGFNITPVGSSDSHDVSRHFVGQGRTYIQCDDSDPGNINTQKAVQSFIQGRVLVSYGLLIDIRVNDQYGPGDIVTTSGKSKVSVRVLGPSWVSADKVFLFANGQLIREAAISAEDGRKAGVKWIGEWSLADLQHDVHLVAMAIGPGVKELYWPMAKAYQPDSPDWTPRAIASTGAVWLDNDGDRLPTSAYKYATQLYRNNKNKPAELISKLAKYDLAVTAQVASLIRNDGRKLDSPELISALNNASPQVRAGYFQYKDAWRNSQIKRSELK